jgi:hemolysin activation/secretion protein
MALVRKQFLYVSLAIFLLTGWQGAVLSLPALSAEPLPVKEPKKVERKATKQPRKEKPNEKKRKGEKPREGRPREEKPSEKKPREEKPKEEKQRDGSVSPAPTLPPAEPVQPALPAVPAPRIVSEPKILVNGFRITGNSVVPEKELLPLTDHAVGRELTLRELEQIAESLAQLYQNKGYTLASAYLPEQEFAEGIIEIAILEGRLSEIRISGNRFYSTDFIRHGFSQVIAERVIKPLSLERSLLLLNGNMDLKVSATLEPGATIGTTQVLAKVEDQRPIHARLDVNNFGIPAISRYRFGAGADVGNLLVQGSVLKLDGIIGDDPTKLQFLTTAYQAPLNGWGTKLVFSGSTGRFDVGGALASLGITGKIRTYDISITHPLIRQRLETLTVEAGFASKDNPLFINGTLSGDDHLRMAKVGVNYDRTDGTGRTFLSLYGFQGLGKVLGGMADNDPLATRQGVDNRFTKVASSLGRIQSLGHEYFLVLQSTGQMSTGPLAIIEQFMLGGADTVRGYQLGERLEDDAYAVSAEVRTPAYLPYTQFVAFLDHGAGRVHQPAAGEARYHALTGAGVGARVTLPYYESSIRCDVGFPISPSTPLGGTLSGGSSPSVYLQFLSRF